MANMLRSHLSKMLSAFTLILCFMLPSSASAFHLKDASRPGVDDYPFSVLILGDSQMAGAGWEGGYANCIAEAYPNVQMLNLAQIGSLLVNGDIHAQWEFYLNEGFPQPDFILLDGGINDLPYIQKKEFEDTGLSLVQEALRSLIESMHTISPDTRIIFVIMPPLEEWKDSENGPPSYAIQEHYWKQINAILNNYDYVTTLDLFSLNPFHYPCADCYHQNLADSIHLNEAGYRKTFEYIDNVLLANLAKKQMD